MPPADAKQDHEIVRSFQASVKSFNNEFQQWFSQVGLAAEDLTSARQGVLPLIRLEKLLGQAPALLDHMDGLRELANRIHPGSWSRRS